MIPEGKPGERRWAAGIDLDDGRLGHIAIFGLRSRDDAIAWHQQSNTHKRWWWCKPSGWIRRMEQSQ